MPVCDCPDAVQTSVEERGEVIFPATYRDCFDDLVKVQVSEEGRMVPLERSLRPVFGLLKKYAVERQGHYHLPVLVKSLRPSPARNREIAIA